MPYDCLLGIAPGTIGVDFRWTIGFEDRLQHQQRCCHADPIPHARDAQRPEFAVGLRYEHASDWLRPVGLLPEDKRQFSQPPLHPVCLDVRKILAVDARRALVRAALGIGVCQNVVAADLVVQGVEAIAGRGLRFRKLGFAAASLGGTLLSSPAAPAPMVYRQYRLSPCASCRPADPELSARRMPLCRCRVSIGVNAYAAHSASGLALCIVGQRSGATGAVSPRRDS
jgi:hypothetical protein